MNIQLSAAIACGMVSEPVEVEVGDGRRGPKGCKVMTDVVGPCGKCNLGIEYDKPAKICPICGAELNSNPGFTPNSFIIGRLSVAFMCGTMINICQRSHYGYNYYAVTSVTVEVECIQGEDII